MDYCDICPVRYRCTGNCVIRFDNKLEGITIEEYLENHHIFGEKRINKKMGVIPISFTVEVPEGMTIAEYFKLVSEEKLSVKIRDVAFGDEENEVV